jgi:Fe-S cluster assembly ATP-binding protein
MMQGRIVKSGGPELAERLENEGYDWIKEELGIVDERVGVEEEFQVPMNTVAPKY